MNRFEKVVTAISNSFYRHGYDFSEAEINLIAKDLLTSGLFENKMTVDELEQGEIFKWGEKEFIKLDSTAEGCLCLAKDVWFSNRFDDRTNDWSKSQLRGDIARKAVGRIPDANKLMLFDRNLTTDDGLTDYGHCKDSVSMLTCDEYRKYREFIPTTEKWCWTITAWTNNGDWVRCVNSSGCIDRVYIDDNSNWVRPLICLDKDTLVEVEE